MILFRHCDGRYPFLWESEEQPAGRWHGDGEGPAQYLADTPDGAWAEFLRHEEITDAEDLKGLRRALWAVEIDIERERIPESAQDVDLADDVVTGGPATYTACQAEARRLRNEGARVVIAPSAALRPGAAGGWRVDAGYRQGARRTGYVYVFFGRMPDAVGWAVVDQGCPPASVLSRVRYFDE